MRALFLSALVAIAPGIALAQQGAPPAAGDSVKGHALASKVCAACHSVEAGAPAVAPSPNGNAPTFASVANTSGMTAAALQAFIYTPHHLMPDLVIPQDDARDLIAYILSLRRLPPI